MNRAEINSVTRARPIILVTAFEPFGASPVNPTMAILRALREMPCAFGSRAYATLPVVTGVDAGSLRLRHDTSFQKSKMRRQGTPRPTVGQWTVGSARSTK